MNVYLMNGEGRTGRMERFYAKMIFTMKYLPRVSYRWKVLIKLSRVRPQAHHRRKIRRGDRTKIPIAAHMGTKFHFET